MHDDIDKSGHPAPPVGGMAKPAGSGEELLSDRSRWLAACSYLFVLSVFVMYEAKQKPDEDDFVRFHARQGFVLFFIEFVLVVVSTILNHTVGKIEVLGAVVMVTFNLCVGLAGVGVSVMGFVNALSGERWTLPFLSEYAKRVPLS